MHDILILLIKGVLGGGLVVAIPLLRRLRAPNAAGAALGAWLVVAGLVAVPVMVA